MSELQPLICKCCCGQIDRTTLVCKSCGTAYRLDDNMQPVKLEITHFELETIGSCVSLPKEFLIHMGEDKAMEYTLQEMAHQMAKKIIPLIEIQNMFDMARQEYTTYGRLRVARPAERGGKVKL